VFWTFAAAALFAAAFITLSPLLRAKSLWQPLALALVFLLPAGAAWMYTQVGTPAAIDISPPPKRAVAAATEVDATAAHSSESQEMDAMIDGLRSRLEQNPDDLDGWMLLSRTLKATQRFEESLQALETANRISPDNPFIAVDMVETRIYLTPDGRISPEMVATLEQIVAAQPDMQKALWLLGIAASQAGDNATAVAYWESLLTYAEPDSNVAKSVQSQINAAKAQMGARTEQPAAGQPVAAESETAHPATAAPVAAEPAAHQTAPADPGDGSWAGIRVTVSASEASAARIPAGGVLYVMIRSPGPAMGPPIGVRRIIDPKLPLEISISDRDSMLQERQISAETEVQLQARISLTGSPAASTGDWQSSPVMVTLDSAETVELEIAQRVE